MNHHQIGKRLQKSLHPVQGQSNHFDDPELGTFTTFFPNVEAFIDGLEECGLALVQINTGNIGYASMTVEEETMRSRLDIEA